MGLSKRDTMNVLVGAFEGGSNYWVDSVKKEYPEEASVFFMPSKKLSGKDINLELLELETPLKVPKDPEDLKKFKEETGFHGLYDTLLNGGELEICGERNICGKISMKTIRKKTPEFIKAHPKRWKRIKEKQEDAIDSDAFLQFMLFDKVMFG